MSKMIVLADVKALIAQFERHGGILWEPGKEGRVGWAICPCCDERNLRIEIQDEAGA